MKAILAAAALLLVPTLAEAAGSCVNPDITGLYSGTARDSQGENIDITLNVYCDRGKLAAQIFTSMADFSVTEVKSGGDHLSIAFDTGAALGTIELTRKPDVLAGSVDIAGDKATLSLSRKGDALAADAMSPNVNLTPAQWHADLSYLATELPKRHANAFFFISKDDLAREVAALDTRIDTANSDEIFVGLQQIVKSVGDGHTGISTPPPDRRVMPLEFSRFGDDFRVVAVGPGLDAALGSRLLKIGEMPIAEVWRRVLTLTSQAELMTLREEAGFTYLSRGYALHGLDVIPERNHALYTLEDDTGRVFSLDIKGLEANQDVATKSAAPDTALRVQNKDAAFWCKPLPESGALYCDWRAYPDLAADAKKMFTTLDASHARKLIIDMRDNGGGDNTVGYSEIIKPIEARADINAPGHLYVLVGADTFSAAMNNAAQFQDETKAILVGQTIGEKPNSYQEPRQFRLPNSHLVVRASTLYYEFRKHGENAVRPNKEIIPTWDDVKAGRDPVLEWVLAQPAN